MNNQETGHRRAFRPALVLLLAGLVVLISASVILADVLAPRHRAAAAAHTPATQPGSRPAQSGGAP